MNVVGDDLSNPYKRAFDRTHASLVRRSVHYKWLVVFTAVVGFLSIGGCLVLGTLAAALGVLLLPFATLVVLALDIRLVHQWRHEVLGDWRVGRIRLDLLAQSLPQAPHLPAVAVQGLLDSLPVWSPTEWPPPAVRESLVLAQAVLARLAMLRLIVRALAWAVLVCGGMAAWMAGSGELLAVWLLLPLGGLAWHRGQMCRMRRARADITLAWKTANRDWAGAVPWLAGLCWDGVPACLQQAWQVRAVRRPGTRSEPRTDQNR